MTEDQNSPDEESSAGPKKVSLGGAMKRMLEQKKQDANQNKGQQDHFSTETKRMRSQIKKKPNNQKKRTGV